MNKIDQSKRNQSTLGFAFGEEYCMSKYEYYVKRDYLTTKALKYIILIVSIYLFFNL